MLKHKAEYKHSKRKTRRKKIIWFSGQLACYYSQFSNIFSRGWETQVENHTSAFLSSRPWFSKFVVPQWCWQLQPKTFKTVKAR